MERKSSYIIDSSTGAETTRLIDQDVMITQATGVFPASLDLSGVSRLLDVACGPGGWAREAARQLPAATVIGVDIHQGMVDYATAFVQTMGSQNLSFQVMDVMRPLEFADASFDLVHARFLVGLLYRKTWPFVVQEYTRITRPGGWIILTESDKFITSNSQAVENLLELGLKAMERASMFAGASGESVTAHLTVFLREAGLREIHSEHHAIDVSHQTSAHQSVLKNLKTGLLLIQPFILKMGYSSQEELETLYKQAINDIESDNFRGQVDLTRAWGQRV